MKHYSDEEFLAKCRDINFSADNHNEKNLVELKKKLLKIKEENAMMMKNRGLKKPAIAIVAALTVTLSLTAVALGDQVWRYLQTRVVEGEELVEEFFVKELDENTTISGITFSPDARDGGRIVVEVEGELRVIQDESHFDNLAEALNLFVVDNPLLPSSLPEGYVFDKATFPVCPVKNPDQEDAADFIILKYSDGHDSIYIQVSHYPEIWGTPQMMENPKEVVVNGRTAAIDEFRLLLHIGDVLYIMYGDNDNVTQDELISIAESLKRQLN